METFGEWLRIIRVLFRAGKRLSDEDAKKRRQVAEALCPEAFSISAPSKFFFSSTTVAL